MITISSKKSLSALKSDIKTSQFTFECPNCNEPISITLEQIGTSINCPSCNEVIHLSGDLDSILHDVNKSIDKFAKLKKN